ncbi:MAG: iron ABC transporter permease [Thermodesulfobacteriota bacterium]
MKGIRKRTLYSVAICSAVLIVILAVCVLVGSASIPLKTVLGVLLKSVGLGSIGDAEISRSQEVILLNIRIPRVLLASLVGGGLAITGCVMQAIFKNPMAEPGVLGWASGGAFVAVVVIYTGLASSSVLILPLGAFAGTLITAYTVYKVATVNGYTPSSVLLLTGVALGSLFIALTTLVLTLANVWTMKEMLFWLLGGVDARGWAHIRLAAPAVAVGAVGILFYARELNAMLLGEEVAVTLGVNVQRTKTVLLVLCSLVVGACVSVSGVIGFVGLIVPHLMRFVVGADHRALLPTSFLTGAVFLPLADLLSRTLARPIELRLGIITACLGVPFFLYLLKKNRAKLAGVS